MGVLVYSITFRFVQPRGAKRLGLDKMGGSVTNLLQTKVLLQQLAGLQYLALFVRELAMHTHRVFTGKPQCSRRFRIRYWHIIVRE